VENKLLDDSPSTALIWDEKHLKALLRLHHYPIHLIQVEPWQTWIERHGGAGRVLDHLQAQPLHPNQQQVLNIVLAHPGVSARLYSSKLNISSSAYFFRLKDLSRTLLLRLNAWNSETPQVLSKSTIPTNLPSMLTPLIGAHKSLADVAAILRRPGTRMLTLTGTGGVGKTRLAIAVGAALLENFPDGVFFIPLETVNDPGLLVTQIARSLNLGTVGAQSLLEALKSYLRERQMLLILDNFEQLIQGTQTVTDLLQAAGNLKVLVTSREALNLYGEIRFTVPELTRPDPGSLPSVSQLGQWPALDLFVQRVQARHPDFVVNEANLEAIVDICDRLDGLPLALELAAAQVRLLAPDHALPQLEHRLRTLRDISHDRPLRQRTMWDAINWSYQLLPEPEKAMLRRLAIFGREWSLEAARDVCQMDDLLAGLEELVDKNLLRYVGQGEDGQARFQMLHPIREYALEQLADSAEMLPTQRRHAVRFLELVQRAEPAIGTPDQLHWLRRIRQERENLQIALQWMLDQAETEMAFKLLGAVWRYYNMLNFGDEIKLWMDRALTQGAHLKIAARVKTLWGAYWLTVRQNDHSKSLPLAEEGLRIARELEDLRLTGLLLQCMVSELFYRNQYDEASQAIEESLRIFLRLGDQDEIAWALGHRSALFSRRGDLVKSRETLEESLSIFRANGNDWAVEQVLRDLALLLLQQGDLEQVKIVLEESLMLSEKMGKSMGVGWTLNLQGRLALQRSDFVAARELFEKAQVIFQQIGDQTALVNNLEYLNRPELIEKSMLKD